MLSRLAVGQKLGLLLTVPLAALMLILVPFSVDRLDEARAAGATADAARSARDVGRLVQELQQERLLALGYLLLPAVDRAALVAQAQNVTDGTARLRRATSPSAELDRALARLSTLATVRSAVLRRQAEPAATYQAYRDAVRSLLDALRLTAPGQLDARGSGQLDALDALLRANEEASGAGAAIVTATGDPRDARSLVLEATAGQRLQGERFRLLAESDQAALLSTVERGATGRRINGFTDAFRATGARPDISLPDALTVAGSYGGLRRIVQDRIAGDLADQAQRRADAARLTAVAVLAVAVVLLATVLFLSVAVYRSITRPLRRLTRAAGVVAELAGAELARVADSDDEEARPAKLAAVDIRSADEIGELAAAFNRVQATAALLLERQVATRRNVGQMFADVAQRTRTLVSRQLRHIDDLERDEQDSALLEKLYRLDHLTNRLRRSASSLMVVSGRSDRSGTAQPGSLADVVRSALGEIENFQVVRLGSLPDAVISADLVDDLRLLLAELLENATAFSPPGMAVDVFADLPGDCHLTIVDRGIGMPPDRLAKENERLLGRERIDILPTSTLGLFVVGRLARRHGLRVRLAPTPEGGVTATVVVPASRLLRSSWASREPALSGTIALAPEPDRMASDRMASAGMGSAGMGPARLALPPEPDHRTDFTWFQPPPTTSAAAIESAPAATVELLPQHYEPPAPAADEPPSPPPAVPAAEVPPPVVPPPAVPPAVPASDQRPPAPLPSRPVRDAPPDPAVTWLTEPRQPATPRQPVDGDPAAHPTAGVPFAGSPNRPAPLPQPAAVPAYAAEPAPAAEPTPVAAAAPSPAPAVRGGLTRRVPGAHLAQSLQDELSDDPGRIKRDAPAAARDPEAERAAFAGYTAGLHRAEQSMSTNPAQR